MAQQQPHPLFTLDLLLASGCEDNAQTRKMVEELNRISQVLGRELMSYLEKIVNTVKSKTDELRSVIDFGAPEAPQTAQKCTTEELLQHVRNSEKLGSELKAQKEENKNLRRNVVAQEMNFRTFLKSHNIKCLEMDHNKYEVIRHSICLDDHMLAFNQAKAALGSSITKKDKEIAELRKQLVAPVSPEEPILLHDLTAEDSSTEPPVIQSSKALIQDFIGEQKIEQKKTIEVIAAMENNLAKRLVTFIDPFDKKTAVCPVPVRNGYLISLKHVYNSWRNDGVKNRSIDWNIIPPFRMPGSSDSDTLADPDQILLIHHITRDLGISTEPPFKVQYKKNQEEEEEWRDIDLTDQIRIASVMYQLKHTQGDASKITNCCMVHQNQLLVEVSLGQKVFEFKLFEIKLQASSPIEEIPSRFIVSDSSYELF